MSLSNYINGLKPGCIMIHCLQEVAWPSKYDPGDKVFQKSRCEDKIAIRGSDG